MRKKWFPLRRTAPQQSNHISILFAIIVGCCTFRAQSFMQRAVPSIIIRHAPPITNPNQLKFAVRRSFFANMASDQLKYIDAGANLLDSMYQGTYHSKPRHEPDLDLVLRRAYDKHVHKVISLAGAIKESEELMELIHGLDSEKKKEEEEVKVFGTVGVHPTRCAEVFAQETSPSTTEEGGEEEEPAASSWIPKTEQERNEIIQQLIDLATRGKESGNIVAIGECGLDYARLQFCPKEIQQLGLRAQLEVAIETKLPLYLHNRESGDDLYGLLLEFKDRLCQDGSDNIRGIVHSFDESIEIAKQFLALGLYIGINGCSLKTADNLSVVKELPLDRVILETDCPWCDIRPSHASAEYVQTTFPTKKDKQYTRELGEEYCVKNRTEPCHVAQVAEVVAGIRGEEVEEVVKVCCQNVYDLFGSLEKKR